jgi:phosphoglycolate phosphatase
MTSPGTDAAGLGAIIARTSYLLLDFDGPICSIYAGLPAPTVAAQLRKLFPGDLPEEIANTPDPIEVFTYLATASDELAARVEAEMADLEVAAVPTADPTPYVRQVIASARESGRIIGVVSNNSPRAVKAYLDRHGLSDGIRLVVARTSHDPALLKPSPYLINEAVRGLDADPAATALVGDSFTDIEAAHRADVASIGYANKPGKRERMTELGAGAVITSMADLALSLRAHRPKPRST